MFAFISEDAFSTTIICFVVFNERTILLIFMTIKRTIFRHGIIPPIIKWRRAEESNSMPLFMAPNSLAKSDKTQLASLSK